MSPQFESAFKSALAHFFQALSSGSSETAPAESTSTVAETKPKAKKIKHEDLIAQATKVVKELGRGAILKPLLAKINVTAVSKATPDQFDAIKKILDEVESQPAEEEEV